MRTVSIVLACCALVASPSTHAKGNAAAAVPLAAPAVKQRMIVLSDIEADPDDTQSFVRLFLYASEIDLEGLIATTSVHM